MILDHLDNADTYAGLHPLFPQAFAYLRQFKADTPPGKYEIVGSDLFALVQAYETAPAATRRYESHEKYLDIQYYLVGPEIIWVTSREGLAMADPYSAEKDITFYAGGLDEQPLRMRPGWFCVLYPQDVHKPNCADGEPGPAAKVVLKVRLPE